MVEPFHTSQYLSIRNVEAISATISKDGETWEDLAAVHDLPDIRPAYTSR